MLRLKALIAMLAVSFGLGLSPAAHADTEIVAIPTSWRLQNYIGTQELTAWFTGSSCSNGLLSFWSTSTADDRNRFYSLVLTAKVSGKTIGVFYETVSGSCQIQSFYIQT